MISMVIKHYSKCSWTMDFFPGKLGLFKQVTMLETRIISGIKPCYVGDSFMLLKIKMHSLILKSQSSCDYLAGPEDSDSAPTAGNSLRARVAPWRELRSVGKNWDGLKATWLPPTTLNVIYYSDIIWYYSINFVTGQFLLSGTWLFQAVFMHCPDASSSFT